MTTAEPETTPEPETTVSVATTMTTTPVTTVTEPRTTTSPATTTTATEVTGDVRPCDDGLYGHVRGHDDDNNSAGRGSDAWFLLG